MTDRMALARPTKPKSGVDGPRTLFGRFKELHPEIERAITEGHSRQQIREWLAKQDIAVSLGLYDNYLFRARKGSTRPESIPAFQPTPAVTTSSMPNTVTTEKRNEGIEPVKPSENRLLDMARRNEEHKTNAKPERVRWNSTPKKRS